MSTTSIENNTDDGIAVNSASFDTTTSPMVIGTDSALRIGFFFRSFPSTLVFQSMVLNFAITANAGRLQVMLVKDATPTAWSNSSVPGFAQLTNELSVFDSTLTGAFSSGITLDAENMAAVYRQAAFDGSLALSFIWTSSTNTCSMLNRAALLGLNNDAQNIVTTGDNDEFGGFNNKGGPWQTGSSGPCFKCGTFGSRAEWIKDGFNRGVWVCPKCWDPPDQRRNLNLPPPEQRISRKTP